MSPEDVAMLVDRWRDGGMTPAEQQRVAAQLKADPASRSAFLDDIRLQGAMAALVAGQPPQDLWDHIDDAIRAGTSVSGAQRTMAAIDRRAAAARKPQRPSRRQTRRRRTTARSRSWSLLVVAVAAIVLGVMLAWPTRRVAAPVESPVARLELGDAGCRIERAGTTIIATPHMELHADDRIAASAGTVTMRLADGSLLQLAAGGELVLHSDTRQHLARGQLQVQTTSAADDRSLLVVTPHASAQAVGTRFSLRVDDQATHLAVSEGRVRFTPANGPATVLAAGEMAQAPLPIPVQPPEPRVVAFQIVDAYNGEALEPWQHLDTDVTIGSSVFAQGVGVFALTQPEHVGAIRFMLDGEPVEPVQRGRPYSLTPSRDDTGTRRLQPWRPAPGRHVLQAMPIDPAQPSLDGVGALSVTITVIDDL